MKFQEACERVLKHDEEYERIGHVGIRKDGSYIKFFDTDTPDSNETNSQLVDTIDIDADWTLIKKETTLSDKIVRNVYGDKIFISVKDVRAFIKELKEEILSDSRLQGVIDKLAGKELIE